MLTASSSSPPESSRRVVVTGLGCVSPLGINLTSSWSALIAGRCGITLLDDDTADDLGVYLAGQIPHYDPCQDMDPKTARRSERFSQLALSAARQALSDSGLDHSLTDQQKCQFGVSLGVGMGGVEFMFNSSQKYHHRGPRRVSPFLIPQIIPNMAAGLISNTLELKGPNICTTSACASGTHGIGEAFLLIKHNLATTMLAGGAESTICHIALAGFANMGALAKTKDPLKASLPFDRDRQGFVMAEGAGVLLLEEHQAARRRGARIYAEISGYGMSGDAYHMTHPAPNGEGAARCIKQALNHSQLSPNDLHHLNAHGTATPLGDLYEAQAIQTVFGSHTSSLKVSATKGATGHLLGGSGGLEACFTTLALHHSLLPPTTGLHHQDKQITLNLSTEPVRQPITTALSLSLGFGGTNAALVFKKYQP